MNILTFDIEEWFLEKEFWGNHDEKYKVFDKYLDQILSKLDERRFKGTFFCVGGMATDFPNVIRKISDKGHEIGCHSFKHVWLNQMTQEEVYEDTHAAIDALEQCVGKKVKSYRAPAFSIGKNNKYAIEVLYKCGITRDASIFPANRELGGFPQFDQKAPSLLFCENVRIKEFPICTTKVFGKEMAYSGGGYFRFFPLDFVRKEMANSEYSMTYFHIDDLVQELSRVLTKQEYENYFKEKGTLKNRYMRYIKTNLGKKSAFDKLMKLIDKEVFINIEQADQMIDWEMVPFVVI